MFWGVKKEKKTAVLFSFKFVPLCFVNSKVFVTWGRFC